jgi:hypothetical protein
MLKRLAPYCAVYVTRWTQGTDEKKKQEAFGTAMRALLLCGLLCRFHDFDGGMSPHAHGLEDDMCSHSLTRRLCEGWRESAAATGVENWPVETSCCPLFRTFDHNAAP